MLRLVFMMLSTQDSIQDFDPNSIEKPNPADISDFVAGRPLVSETNNGESHRTWKLNWDDIVSCLEFLLQAGL